MSNSYIFCSIAVDAHIWVVVYGLCTIKMMLKIILCEFDALIVVKFVVHITPMDDLLEN